MNESEIKFWSLVRDDLQIEILAPFDAQFRDGSGLKVSALIKGFGPLRGMLIHSEYAALEPYKDRILEAGYGYSIFAPREYNRAGMIEVLEDWSWSGAADKKPVWLGG
jgi:hypothetical protein